MSGWSIEFVYIDWGVTSYSLQKDKNILYFFFWNSILPLQTVQTINYNYTIGLKLSIF